MSAQYSLSARSTEVPWLEHAALHADGTTLDTADLAELWEGLASGRARGRFSFSTATRSFLVVTREAARPGPGFRPRNLGFLERVLLGECQKTVALDSGLAPSTIAIALSDCLTAMGFGRRAISVPVSLVMAVHACRGETEFRTARVSRVDGPDAVWEVLSTPRPELALGATLSKAEYEVATLLAEGHSYRQIAAARGTSVRTIANQIAAIFQKVGVSGRLSLLCQLVRARGAAPAPVRKRAPVRPPRAVAGFAAVGLAAP